MREHREFFNLRAETWDSFKTPEEAVKARDLLSGLGIKPGESVLDAGCGTGFLFPLIKTLVGETGRVTGLDISEKMIASARKKFGSAADYFTAPACSIPAGDGVFDRIICYSAFPHFPDKKRALAEFSRVLRSAGWLHIIHSSSRNSINALHRGIGGAVRSDRIPPDVKMRELLGSAGFTCISVQDGRDSYAASGRLA